MSNSPLPPTTTTISSATEWKWAPMVVPFTCERGESKDTSLSTPDSG